MEQLEDLDPTAKGLVKKLFDNYSNTESLSLLLREVVLYKFNLAENIAAFENTINQQTKSIRENSYKMTLTEARIEAEGLIGVSLTEKRMQFEACNSLIDVINARISLLLREKDHS